MLDRVEYKTIIDPKLKHIPVENILEVIAAVKRAETEVSSEWNSKGTRQEQTT